MTQAVYKVCSLTYERYVAGCKVNSLCETKSCGERDLLLFLQNYIWRTFPVVQWLELCCSNAGAPGFIPDQELDPTVTTKILHAPTKTNKQNQPTNQKTRTSELQMGFGSTGEIHTHIYNEGFMS